MIEKHLVEHCSPTLASLKTANLFSYRFDDYENLQDTLKYWNDTLTEKGIKLRILKMSNNTALIYVYRESFLKSDLEKNGVLDFLKLYGYDDINVEYALDRLSSRIKEGSDFPHEIGIFLNYPLEDVVGFIVNQGKNCKCVGCWKVYCNECDAVKKFQQFKKCTKIYTKLWQDGRSVEKLSVAV